MERKRRQRINNCLSQIKRMIPEARELEVGTVYVLEFAAIVVKDNSDLSSSVHFITSYKLNALFYLSLYVFDRKFTYFSTYFVLIH